MLTVRTTRSSRVRTDPARYTRWYAGTRTDPARYTNGRFRTCMSPYSMPLCTILTKLPEPPGPTWVTQGPSFTCAATFFTTSSMRAYASGDPPGIIDGPAIT
eukprot:9492215-Pyramimonas_sp.AAC.1